MVLRWLLGGGPSHCARDMFARPVGQPPVLASLVWFTSVQPASGSGATGPSPPLTAGEDGSAGRRLLVTLEALVLVRGWAALPGRPDETTRLAAGIAALAVGMHGFGAAVYTVHHNRCRSLRGWLWFLLWWILSVLVAGGLGYDLLRRRLSGDGGSEGRRHLLLLLWPYGTTEREAKRTGGDPLSSGASDDEGGQE